MGKISPVILAKERNSGGLKVSRDWGWWKTRSWQDYPLAECVFCLLASWYSMLLILVLLTLSLLISDFVSFLVFSSSWFVFSSWFYIFFKEFILFLPFSFILVFFRFFSFLRFLYSFSTFYIVSFFFSATSFLHFLAFSFSYLYPFFLSPFIHLFPFFLPLLPSTTLYPPPLSPPSPSLPSPSPSPLPPFAKQQGSLRQPIQRKGNERSERSQLKTCSQGRLKGGKKKEEKEEKARFREKKGGKRSLYIMYVHILYI